MMEKYAVDLKEIPPTDDQLRTIKRLAKECSCELDGMPKTASEANELIQDLELEK